MERKPTGTVRYYQRNGEKNMHNQRDRDKLSDRWRGGKNIQRERFISVNNKNGGGVREASIDTAESETASVSNTY